MREISIDKDNERNRNFSKDWLVGVHGLSIVQGLNALIRRIIEISYKGIKPEFCGLD